jgi:predicted GIY-YIG superfamily endonuclease
MSAVTAAVPIPAVKRTYRRKPKLTPQVYLIHIDKPIGTERHSAQHYIGYTENLIERLATHRKGGAGAAKLLAHAKLLGVKWQCVRTWFGADRAFERRLKNAGHYSKLCPICQDEPPF